MAGSADGGPDGGVPMPPMTRDQIIEMIADQMIDGRITDGVPQDEILARITGTGPDSPVMVMFGEPVSGGRILLVIPRQADNEGLTTLVESFPEMVADLIAQANFFMDRMN